MYADIVTKCNESETESSGISFEFLHYSDSLREKQKHHVGEERVGEPITSRNKEEKEHF